MTWLTHSIQLFLKHAARILNLKLLSRISMAYRLVTDTFLLSNSMGFQKTRRLWMMNLTLSVGHRKNQHNERRIMISNSV